MDLCKPLTDYGVQHHPADHILGTTQTGKDVWTQTLYGGRVSILVGILRGSIAVLLSLIVGITVGYFGRYS